MEESRAVREERGVALVVVLMAIVVLLPPTIVLATFALRWQRQAIDMRDGMQQDYLVEAALEQARNRLSGSAVQIEPGDGVTFRVRELAVEARISRGDDVVVTLGGGILEGRSADQVDLDATGIDADGRVVYQYRRLEIYLVEVELQKRPSLAPAKLQAVLARLPNGSVETLGLTRSAP